MPELIFDPEPHLYYLDGVRIPNVTTVLEATGLIDYSRLNPLIRAEALARGRWVADLCALRMLEGPLDPALMLQLYAEYPRRYQYFLAFERFLAERPDCRPQMVERRVYHAQNGLTYAGTLDFTAIFDQHIAREHALIDIKTGTAPVATAYQTAAYHLALPSLTDYEFRDKPHRRYALELNPDRNPPYRLIPYRSDSRDRTVWLAALTVFNHQEERLREAA